MSGLSKGKARKARQREAARLEAMRLEAIAVERATLREAIAAKLTDAGEYGSPSTPMAAAMLAAVEA